VVVGIEDHKNRNEKTIELGGCFMKIVSRFFTYSEKVRETVCSVLQQGQNIEYIFLYSNQPHRSRRHLFGIVCSFYFRNQTNILSHQYQGTNQFPV